ncbi:AbrB/MazE/SpoVT family DNA-binding domain-containing protein [Christensenellaceae bacterium OttesenSCG-928-K19]|nr:AbrB/MazE/SpoVT family DNA-binding domain-containing protein [Christensenellaceae bacterium OttesenSCG-928-K19]
MKSTGIVRPLDSLGRVVLPIELRRVLDLGPKDPVEIYVDGDYILLKKYQPSCIFCESMEDITTYNGKNVCASCIDKLAKK